MANVSSDSLGESNCYCDPNFAVICSFLSKFSSFIGFPAVSFQRLKADLEDNKQLSPQLSDILLLLLRRIGKSVKPDKLDRAIVKFSYTFSGVDGWEVEELGFSKAKLETKLRILKNLLEAQFDTNVKFKEKINQIPTDVLHVLPIGRDKNGLAYWYLLDEDVNLTVYREGEDDIDSETWQLVCSDRDDLQRLISDLQLTSLATLEPSTNSDDSNSSNLKSRTATPEVKSEMPDLSEGAFASVTVKPRTTNSSCGSSTTALKAEVVQDRELDIENEKNENERKKQGIGTDVDLMVANEQIMDVIKSVINGLIEEVEKEVNGNNTQGHIEKCTEVERQEGQEDLSRKLLLRSASEVDAKENADIFVSAQEDVSKNMAASGYSDQNSVTVNHSRSNDGDEPCDDALHGLNSSREIHLHVETNANVDANELNDGVLDDVRREFIGCIKELLSDLVTTVSNSNSSETQFGGEERGVIDGEGLISAASEIAADESHSDCGVDLLKKCTNNAEGEDTVGVSKSGEAVSSDLKEVQSDDNGEGEMKRLECIQADVKEVVDESLNEVDKLVKREYVGKDGREDETREEETREMSKKEFDEDDHLQKKRKVILDVEDLKEMCVNGADVRDKAGGKVISGKKSKKRTMKQKVVVASGCNDENAALMVGETNDLGMKMSGDDSGSAVTPRRTSSRLRSKRSMLLRTAMVNAAVSSAKKRTFSDEEERLSADEAKVVDEPQAKRIKTTSRAGRCRSAMLRKRAEARKNKTLCDDSDDDVPLSRAKMSKTAKQQSKKSQPSTTSSKKKKKTTKRKVDSDEDFTLKKTTVCKKGQKRGRTKRRRSSSESEEEEESEIESEESLVWASSSSEMVEESADDFEYKPGRNALRAAARASNSLDNKTIEDDTPCKICGKYDQAELILLCDQCDMGYHTACLRPPLMLIPADEWFCPICEHRKLISQLIQSLQALDSALKKKDMLLKREERLKYVGISLSNIIPEEDKENARPEAEVVVKKEDKEDESDDNSSTSSDAKNSRKAPKTGSKKSSDKRACRTRSAVNYRFPEYFDMINEAIGEEDEEVPKKKRSGKDMSNITGVENDSDGPPSPVNRKRNKRRRLTELDVDSNTDESEEYRATEDTDPDASVEEFEDAYISESDSGPRSTQRYGRPTRSGGKKKWTRYDRDFVVENSDEDVARRRSTRASSKKTVNYVDPLSDSEEEALEEETTEEDASYSSDSSGFMCRKKNKNKCPKKVNKVTKGNNHRKRVVYSDSDDDADETDDGGTDEVKCPPRKKAAKECSSDSGEGEVDRKVGEVRGSDTEKRKRKVESEDSVKVEKEDKCKSEDEDSEKTDEEPSIELQRFLPRRTTQKDVDYKRLMESSTEEESDSEKVAFNPAPRKSGKNIDNILNAPLDDEDFSKVTPEDQVNATVDAVDDGNDSSEQSTIDAIKACFTVKKDDGLQDKDKHSSLECNAEVTKFSQNSIDSSENDSIKKEASILHGYERTPSDSTRSSQNCFPPNSEPEITDGSDAASVNTRSGDDHDVYVAPSGIPSSQSLISNVQQTTAETKTFGSLSPVKRTAFTDLRRSGSTYSDLQPLYHSQIDSEPAQNQANAVTSSFPGNGSYEYCPAAVNVSYGTEYNQYPPYYQSPYRPQGYYPHAMGQSYGYMHQITKPHMGHPMNPRPRHPVPQHPAMMPSRTVHMPNTEQSATEQRQQIVDQAPRSMDQMPPRSMDQMPPRSMDQMPPRSVEQLLPQPMDQMQQRYMDQMPPRSMDQMQPRSIDQMPPRSMDQMPPRSMDQMPPRSMDQMPQRPMDQMPPRSMDQMPPRSVDQMPSQSADQMPPRPIDLMSQRSIDQGSRSTDQIPQHKIIQPRAMMAQPRHLLVQPPQGSGPYPQPMSQMPHPLQAMGQMIPPHSNLSQNPRMAPPHPHSASEEQHRSQDRGQSPSSSEAGSHRAAKQLNPDQMTQNQHLQQAPHLNMGQVQQNHPGMVRMPSNQHMLPNQQNMGQFSSQQLNMGQANQQNLGQFSSQQPNMGLMPSNQQDFGKMPPNEQHMAGNLQLNQQYMGSIPQNQQHFGNLSRNQQFVGNVPPRQQHPTKIPPKQQFSGNMSSNPNMQPKPQHPINMSPNQHSSNIPANQPRGNVPSNQRNMGNIQSNKQYIENLKHKQNAPYNQHPPNMPSNPHSTNMPSNPHPTNLPSNQHPGNVPPNQHILPSQHYMGNIQSNQHPSHVPMNQLSSNIPSNQDPSSIPRNIPPNQQYVGNIPMNQHFGNIPRNQHPSNRPPSQQHHSNIASNQQYVGNIPPYQQIGEMRVNNNAGPVASQSTMSPSQPNAGQMSTHQENASKLAIDQRVVDQNTTERLTDANNQSNDTEDNETSQSEKDSGEQSQVMPKETHQDESSSHDESTRSPTLHQEQSRSIEEPQDHDELQASGQKDLDEIPERQRLTPKEEPALTSTEDKNGYDSPDAQSRVSDTQNVESERPAFSIDNILHASKTNKPKQTSKKQESDATRVIDSTSDNATS